MVYDKWHSRATCDVQQIQRWRLRGVRACATTLRCCVRVIGACSALAVASRAKHNEDCIVYDKWHYVSRLRCADTVAWLRIR